MESGVFGLIVGLLMGFVLTAYMVNSELEDNPRYYNEYNDHKRECEKSLPRDQECYVEYVWKTKEIEL